MSAIKELYGLYFSHWTFIMTAVVSAGLWLMSHPFAGAASSLERRSVTVLAVAVLALGALQMAIYPFMPNYVDYVEPMVAVLALNSARGAPLYGDWAHGGGVQGSLFGPLVFLVQAAFLKISPTIAMSKIAGIAAAAANLALLAAVLRKVVRDWPRTLILLALFLVLVVGFRHFWFWNRPDPLLILLSTAGLAAYLWMTPRMALVTIGLLAGLAANLKLYTPLYLVPVGFMCFLALPTWRARIGYGLVAAVGSVLIFLPPYLSPAIEFGPFLHNLMTAGKLGLSLSVFMGSLVYCGLLAAPAAILLCGRKASQRSTEDVAFLGIFLAVLVVLAVVTAKQGSGAPHLMPMAPVGVFLLARLLDREAAGARAATDRAAGWAMVLGFICVAPIWIWSFREIVGDLKPSVERARAAEAKALFRAYPSAEMSVEYTTYRGQFYRVYKVFDGHVVDVEGVNWMDLRWVGEPVDRVRPLIEDCRTRHWITPNDRTPFSASILGRALFDQQFMTDFTTRYRVVRRGQFFNVWSCASLGGAGGRTDS